MVLMLFMVGFYSFSAKAAVDESQVGPQGPVGPRATVGPRELVVQTSVLGGVSQEAAEPVPESTAVLSNSQTGFNSDNSSTVDSSSSTDATFANDANVNNQAELVLDTGSNSFGTNSVVGGLKTGSINGSVNVLNLANTTLAPDSSVGMTTVNGEKTGEIVLSSPAQRSLLSNSATGPESSNINAVNNSNIVKIIDSNNATANNDLNIKANTGLNTVFKNTKVGDVTTGDINLAANLINLLNVFEPNLTLTLDVWSIMGGLTGDLVFDPSVSNLTTGPQSLNQNTINQNSSTNIGVTQTAAINNNLSYDVNTGKNDIGMGTVVGNVETGLSTVNSSTTNIANAGTPMLYLVNVFGSWDGQLEGIDPNAVIVNQMTGPDSTNTNTVNNNSQTDVQISNNAVANNKVNISANTGKNKIGNNTSVGDIKTGAINLSNNVINVLNSFGQDLSRIKISIINIFGNWKGNGKTTSSNNNQGGSNQGGNDTGGNQNQAGTTDQADSGTSTGSSADSVNPITNVASAASTTDKTNEAGVADISRKVTRVELNEIDKVASIGSLPDGKGYLLGDVSEDEDDQAGMVQSNSIADQQNNNNKKRSLPALPMALGVAGLALAGIVSAKRRNGR